MSVEGHSAHTQPALLETVTVIPIGKSWETVTHKRVLKEVMTRVTWGAGGVPGGVRAMGGAGVLNVPCSPRSPLQACRVLVGDGTGDTLHSMLSSSETPGLF